MFEGAAWQLREEGRTVVVLRPGMSLADAGREVAGIVAQAGVRRAAFKVDGVFLSVRRVSLPGVWWMRLRGRLLAAWLGLRGGMMVYRGVTNGMWPGSGPGDEGSSPSPGAVSVD